MKQQIKPKNPSDKTRSIRSGSSGWYFKMLGNWMDNKMNERLNPLGLSINQFSILMTLLEQEGLTQSEIGKRVMQPAYATTRNLDRLESLGYVIRNRHESSRRSYRIQLTEAGRAIAPELYRATESVNELFFSTLEDKQKTELLNILSVAAKNLGLHPQDI